MFYHVQERKLTLSDTQIDYIRFGNGLKPLIMIQGLNTRGIQGTGIPLAFMYRMFAKDYTVYLFDRRPDAWDGITVRDLAADIACAMDTLGITNADVFGVSQGGMIGQYLAIGRPDLVHKLVLAVTLSKNNDTVQNVIASWMEMTEQGDMKKLVADMAAKMYSDEYVRRYKLFMPLLTVLQKPKNAQQFLILTKSCLTCSTYEELDKIQCPVFVIGGKKDQVIGGYASQEIADKLGCEIYMYEDLGHAAYEEATDFNARVYDFLMR